MVKKKKYNSARDLVDVQWADIKTRWEMGETMRSIARDYGISLGTIQYHIRKQNWSQDLLNATNHVRADLRDIVNLVNDDQKKVVADQIKREIDVIFDLETTIRTLHEKAIGLHNIVLKKTCDQLNNGEISPMIAGRTLQAQGIDVKSIMQTNGLSKEKVSTTQNNTQVNNETVIPVNINLKPRT